jgi:hypothetical protein
MSGSNSNALNQMVARKSNNQLAFQAPPFASPATVLPLKKTKFPSSIATEALSAAPPQAPRLAILETPNKRTGHAHVAAAAACPSQSIVSMDASVAAAPLSESTPLLPPPPRSAQASVQSSVSLKAAQEAFVALDSVAGSPSLPAAPHFSPSPSSMSSSPLFEFSGEEQYQYQRQQAAYSRQQSESTSAHTGLLRFESHESEMGNKLEMENEVNIENDSDLVRPLEQLSLGDISPMPSYMPRASSRLASLSPHGEWNADGGSGGGDHDDYDCAHVYDDSPHRSNHNHRTPHALPSDHQVEKRTLSGNSNRKHKSSGIKPTAPIFTPPVVVPFMIESKVESFPSSSASSSSSSSRTQAHAAVASHSSSNFVHPLHFVLPPPPPPPQSSSLPLSAAVRPLPLSAPLALPAPVLPKTARSFSATDSYLPLPLIASLRTENGKGSQFLLVFVN